jgi:hypothetical protein
MDEKSKRDQGVTEPLDDISTSVIDYSDLIKGNVFLGQLPLDAILESIKGQFEDYINVTDRTNYVDIFYEQLDYSFHAISTRVDEEHPVEKLEALDKIYQTFIDFMKELFETRFTLTIMPLESEDPDEDDVQFIIRRLYEFFVIDARNNFKSVITADALSSVEHIGDNDNEFFRILQELINNQYTPLLISISPEQFLTYRGDKEIIELFENGQVTGNFLRKYSPKFYQNEEFQVEVINHITMVHQFKKNMVDSENNVEEVNTNGTSQN